MLNSVVFIYNIPPSGKSADKRVFWKKRAKVLLFIYTHNFFCIFLSNDMFLWAWSEQGESRGDLWVTYARPLGDLWVTYGRPLGDLWERLLYL